MNVVTRASGVSLLKFAEGSGAPICVIDFARFADVTTLAALLGQESHGRPVYRLDPIRDLADSPVATVDQLADNYVRLLAELDVLPVAIVSYCSMATLALHVGTALGHEPHLVLVEPTWPTTELVIRETSAIRRSLGVDDPLPNLIGADVGDIIAILEQDIEAALSGSELAEELEEMGALLRRRYAAWISFLVMASRAVVPEPTARTHLVTSYDRGYGPAPTWKSAATRTTLHVPHNDLLESPQVRDLVHALLET